jgi:hypothetical protein
MSYIPEPITRIDRYLAYIAGNMEVDLPDRPITRKEHYLAAWAEKSGFEDVEITGEPPLTLTNAIGKPLKGLKVYGRSKQVTTTGAQLLDLDAIGFMTGGGATIRRLDDGGFLVDGTPRKAFEQYITNVAINFSQGTYFISGGECADGCAVVQINILKADGTRTYKSNTSFDVLGTEQEIRLIIQSVSEEPINNYKIYPMINAGSVALPFEPYTGGFPSPSPDYPQEIESVGQDGEIGVEVYGGNLFNARTAINGKVVDKYTGSILSNSRYACSDYIAIPCNAVSLYQNGGTKNQRAFYDSDKNFIAAEVSVNPVTVPKNAKYIRITSEIDKRDMNDIMLSISSTALSYKSYHEPQSISISTPNGLPGIPVSSGGNYTDADGQQWVCDEIDFAKGVYVQNIKVSKNLDNLNWYTWGVNNVTDGITGFFTYDIDTPKIPESISNIARYNEDIHGGERAGICASTIKPTSMTPYMILCVCNDTISDISSDNAAIQSFKEMLAKTDACITYVLAHPIETPLTADQLNAYKALHTYKGTTIIDNDAGAYMSAKYEKMK